LTGGARIRLTDDTKNDNVDVILSPHATQVRPPSSSDTDTNTKSDAEAEAEAVSVLPIPCVEVVQLPPDTAHERPASDIVQDFKVAAVRLLERFAQDASQSVRKRESWTRIARLVDETESERAAALADAIVSAVGAEHTDKLGE
jgi:hypothetical protein